MPLVLPSISVSQPIGTFFLAVMKAGDLLKRVDVHRRGLDPASLQNVQRELSGRRTRDIAAYVTDPDATFPTSVIVSAYPDRVYVSDRGNDGMVLLLGKPPTGANHNHENDGAVNPADLLPLTDEDTIGEVIDGQHRLMGLREAGAAEPSSRYYGFELPVVFMLDLESQHRAYVFSTINSKQTRVSSSLIVDLFGLATTRSPRKTCHEVAAALNAKEGGPFFQTLKMLGKKTRPTESLTQGSFAKYLLALVSRSPEEDERAIKRGEPLKPDTKCPLRPFFMEDRDEMIVRVLDNYFSAIRNVYPNAWEDTDTYALRRTVGFAALMKAFQIVWDAEVVRTQRATIEVFQGIAHRFAEAIPEATYADVASSGATAGLLARQLTASWLGEEAPRGT